MKSTALKIDDVLEDFTCLEDLERSHAVFWAELSRLDMAEDEERNSGKKEEELKYLSIRRFKRAAMTKFARSQQQRHEGVASTVAEELMLEEHSKEAEEVKLSPKAEVAMTCSMALQDVMKAKEVRLSTKSKPEVMMTNSKTWRDEMKIEEEERGVAKANLIHAAKDDAVEEVRTLRLSERGGSKVGKGEPEKEEHEAVDIMIDKEDGSGDADATGQDAD